MLGDANAFGAASGPESREGGGGGTSPLPSSKQPPPLPHAAPTYLTPLERGRGTGRPDRGMDHITAVPGTLRGAPLTPRCAAGGLPAAAHPNRPRPIRRGRSVVQLPPSACRPRWRPLVPVAPSPTRTAPPKLVDPLPRAVTQRRRCPQRCGVAPPQPLTHHLHRLSERLRLEHAPLRRRMHQIPPVRPPPAPPKDLMPRAGNTKFHMCTSGLKAAVAYITLSSEIHKLMASDSRLSDCFTATAKCGANWV